MHSVKKPNRIGIGIHVHAEPENLRKTLASLRMNTHQPIELILLPDGADEETKAFLESISDLRQIGTAEPLGPPACFNRLVTCTDADIFILIESGLLFGTKWLDYILDALCAKTYNGIAGPSTNLSWNQQCIFPNGAESEVSQLANKAERHFGKNLCTLEPLYSLGDFCYAVKREVIEAIGAADERYGLGPCWEMDYNIRAARAGYRGVWACSSYVHRMPFTERRRREEAARFEASRQHYQNKFCRLKLETKASQYCRHCVGEECQYFAPKDLIQIRLPLPKSETLAQGNTKVINYSDIQSVKPLISIKSPINISEPTIEETPLVSCIMPTHNRRSFVPKAIQQFLMQNYPNRELVIVDDGSDRIADIVPKDSRIRYIHQNSKSTIGAKRNLACKEARGEIIVHWDDDDWMAVWRLSYQVGNLLKEKADICGLDKLLFYDQESNQAWQYIYSDKDRPWLAGGTFCYTKSFWNENPFSDTSRGEDTRFIWDNKHRSKKILSLQDNTFYVSMIHSGNTSPKRLTDYRWHPYPAREVQDIMCKDTQQSKNALNGFKSYFGTAEKLSNLPLVSCIMPTYNRRFFVSQAIKYFLRQDYRNKELVIVDNGTDKVMDLIPQDDRIKYIRVEKKELSIGYLRNLAVQQSNGKTIAHWDDDDWYAENRISYQVQPLLEGKAEVCGIDTGFIYNLQENSFWSCKPSLHAKMFYADIHGGSIFFFKELWEKYSKYPDISLAEDSGFLSAISKKARIVKLPNKDIFIYVRHGKNAWKFICGKFINPSEWEHIPAPKFLPKDDFLFYQSFKVKVE